MGPIIPSWLNDFWKRLSEEYPGREFAALMDFDTGSWRFSERDAEPNDGIHIYTDDIEKNGYDNELKKVIEFFKPKDE